MRGAWVAQSRLPATCRGGPTEAEAPAEWRRGLEREAA